MRHRSPESVRPLGRVEQQVASRSRSGYAAAFCDTVESIGASKKNDEAALAFFGERISADKDNTLREGTFALRRRRRFVLR
jgi:hypothetical protein